MIELESPLRLDRKAAASPNLTDRFSDRDLSTIGAIVKKGFEDDDASRSKWKLRYQSAMDMALQLMEGKSFPWAGASNIKFPLITIAALQWHSRAYPVLLNGPHLVKCRVNGPDADGNLANVSRRISDHMSWQLLEEDESWEEGTDRALIQLPIVGCVFKKSYRDVVNNRNISKVVSAQDFVVDYFAPSVEGAVRKTEIMPLWANDVHERVLLGAWRDCLDEGWFCGTPSPTGSQDRHRADRRTGISRPQPDHTTPFDFLEQHVLLDLDNDGYSEPYVITIERNSGYVVRICCAFEWDDITFLGNRILGIKRQQNYTKYEFLPSPDMSVYGVGFGSLLGPLSAAVDSIMNQLVDAGTLATTSGGFLGRGVKIRGGEYNFRPFGWQRLDTQGEDIGKNVFPFPVREPSSVLFQLLSLLIDYVNRVSGSTDIMVGENPGQNTPAQTSQTMVEQGAKINSAIFKRVWRGMKKEFTKLFELNKTFTPQSVTYGESTKRITREDYNTPSLDIRPAADPNLTSDTMKMQQASLVLERAQSASGYDRELVERNFLRAHKIEDIDAIYPGAQKMPAPTPLKVTLEQMKDKREKYKTDQRMKEKLLEVIANKGLTEAQIALLEAQVFDIIHGAQADVAAHAVSMFEAQTAAGKNQADIGVKLLDMYQQGTQNGQPGQSGGQPPGGGVPPMAGGPGNPGAAGGAPD
jgi:chaperonin GroES